MTTLNTPWRIGGFELWQLADGVLEIGVDKVLAPPERVAARLAETGRTLPPRLPVNAFLIRREGRLALVDTGAGETMGPGLGALPGVLEGLGIDPAAIDTVMLTHVHPDHSNGLRLPGGAARFPNAALVVHEADLAFWCDAGRVSDDPALRSRQEMARWQLAPYAGRLRAFATETEVFPGVTALPLPGHTPGHSGYLIADGGDRLLIWGDVTHLPELQVPHPEAGMVFDIDRAQAEATRRAVLARVASEGITVAGMHLPGSGLGRVEAAGGGYRFVPVAAPG